MITRPLYPQAGIFYADVVIIGLQNPSAVILGGLADFAQVDPKAIAL